MNRFLATAAFLLSSSGCLISPVSGQDSSTKPDKVKLGRHTYLVKGEASFDGEFLTPLAKDIRSSEEVKSKIELAQKQLSVLPDLDDFAFDGTKDREFFVEKLAALKSQFSEQYASMTTATRFIQWQSKKRNPETNRRYNMWGRLQKISPDGTKIQLTDEDGKIRDVDLAKLDTKANKLVDLIRRQITEHERRHSELVAEASETLADWGNYSKVVMAESKRRENVEAARIAARTAIDEKTDLLIEFDLPKEFLSFYFPSRSVAPKRNIVLFNRDESLLVLDGIFSKNGKFDDAAKRAIWILDIATGRLKQRRIVPREAVIDPFILRYACYSAVDSTSVEIRDIETDKPILEINEPSVIHLQGFSADGKYFAWSSLPRPYDHTATQERKFRREREYAKIVNKERISIVEIASRSRINQKDVYGNSFWHTAFSNDNRLCATASWDERVRIWSTSDRVSVFDEEDSDWQHTSRFQRYKIKFCPNDKYLATLGQGRSGLGVVLSRLKLRDVDRKTTKVLSERCEGFLFGDHGKYLWFVEASKSDRNKKILYKFDLSDDTKLAFPFDRISHEIRVLGAYGKIVYLVSFEPTHSAVLSCDVSSGNVLSEIRLPGPIVASISPKNSLLVTATFSLPDENKKTQVKVWKLD